MPTTRDIANRTGFSQCTVSLALRNHPRISQATCKKVQQAAKKLGYKMNPTLSAWMNHVKTGTPQSAIANIGFIYQRHKNAYNQKGYLDGATTEAERLGYRIDAIQLKSNESSIAPFSSMLKARGIRGLIFGSAFGYKGNVLPALDWKNYSAIAIGHSMVKPRLNRIASYHYEETIVAMQKAHSLGYRRIGLAFNHNTDRFTDNAVTAGFTAQHQRWNNNCFVPPLIYSEDDCPPQTLKKWLKQYKVEVLLTFPKLLKTLELIDVRIPQDIALINLNWTPTHRRIAGIVQDHTEIGALATRSVINLITSNIQGLPTSHRATLIEGQWKSGATLPPKARN